MRLLPLRLLTVRRGTAEDGEEDDEVKFPGATFTHGLVTSLDMDG
jgi:hypothetical protein